MSFRWPCGKTALLEGLRDTKVRMRVLHEAMIPRLPGNGDLLTCLTRVETINYAQSSNLHMRQKKETRGFPFRLCHQQNKFIAHRRHRVSLRKTAQIRNRLPAQSYSQFLFPSGSLQAGLPYAPSLSETTNGDRLAQQLRSPEPNPLHGRSLMPCPHQTSQQSARNPRRPRVHSLLTTQRRRLRVTTLHSTLHRRSSPRQALMLQIGTHLLPQRCRHHRGQGLRMHRRRLRLGGRHS